MEMTDIHENSDWRNSRGLYGVLTILTSVAGAITLICMAAWFGVAGLSEINQYSVADLDNYMIPEFVHFTSKGAQGDLIGALILSGVAAFLVYLAGLALMSIMTGCFNRDENNRVVLSKFDRMWSEIPVIMVPTCIGVAVAPVIALAHLVPYQNWFGAYIPSDPDMYVYGLKNALFVIIMGLALAAIVAVGDVFFITIVKKIKAGAFLETALLGKVCRMLLRGIKITIQAIRNSDRLVLKTVGALIAAVLLSATGFGAIVMIILIIGLAPNYVRKYQVIRDGLERVNSGDLAYEIPFTEDEFGAKTELDKLAIEINKISKTTEAAVKNQVKNQTMRNELISNVSHDIKTPLTSMISYLDILKREGLDSENAEEYLDIVIDKTNRLKTLTEDLFEAAKASSGDMPCEMIDLNMVSMVEQTLVEMEDRFAGKNLTIVTNYATEDSMVKADGRLLFRVIENVMSNIAKYSLEGSRVYIDVTSDDKMVYMTAKNISRSQLNISPDELMERFKRGDESRNTEGSGLGLAIANDLTDMMHGTFKIEIDGDMFKSTIGLRRP